MDKKELKEWLVDFIGISQPIAFDKISLETSLKFQTRPFGNSFFNDLVIALKELQEEGHIYLNSNKNFEIVNREIETEQPSQHNMNMEKASKNELLLLDTLCNRFHLVAKQIRQRYDNRETLDIQDEYDTQDLLHSMLKIYFDDIRKEEWNPSYAGGSTRSDFLLKNEKVVIEVKKTRKGLKAKELGEQLIIDKAKYKVHPDCQILYCFVYDPEGYIDNPRGIENDLQEEFDKFQVVVKIIPKGH